MCVFGFIMPLYFFTCVKISVINTFWNLGTLPYLIKYQDCSIFSLQIYLFLFQDGRPRYIIEQFFYHTADLNHTHYHNHTHFETDNVLFMFWLVIPELVSSLFQNYTGSKRHLFDSDKFLKVVLHSNHLSDLTKIFKSFLRNWQKYRTEGYVKINRINNLDIKKKTPQNPQVVVYIWRQELCSTIRETWIKLQSNEIKWSSF